MILDGKEKSKKIRNWVKLEVEQLNNPIKLLVILVGKDPASQIYVASKEKACHEVGIDTETWRLDANITQKELVTRIRQANDDVNIHAILVQLPLPGHLDEKQVINEINPWKDVDGLTIANQGKLLNQMKGIVPATPLGVMHLIDEYKLDISGKSAVVIGRSTLVGKPLALLLLQRNATVTIAHSRTTNLREIIKQSDVVVSAIGKGHFITADMIKPGAIVIDVGITRVFGKILGDVDYQNCLETASYITPVPGGVGPMTIATLLENVVECYKNQL